MTQLCKDLSLSIFREADPDNAGNERIRLILRDDLAMMEVETVYHINQTSEQSRRYHIRESVLIGMRQLIGEAFRMQLISDSPGSWTLQKTTVMPNATVL